jgi:uncharacterized integral membrane protein (TIGR00698 family)
MTNEQNEFIDETPTGGTEMIEEADEDFLREVESVFLEHEIEEMETPPYKKLFRSAKLKFVSSIAERYKGFLLAVAIAALATYLAHFAPVVGGPVIAVVSGMILSFFFHQESLDKGLKFTSKRVLQASIAVLGLGLSLHEALSVGGKSLPVMLGTLGVALAVSGPIGKKLGLTRDVNTLVSIGTAICGASAIAAVDAVISAAGAEVAYALGTIFIFNVVAVLTFPVIGHILHMSQHGFGLWAGTAINDASSVVAASTVYGTVARNYGIVVKLTRTLMIVPIALALPVIRRHQDKKREARAMAAGDEVALSSLGSAPTASKKSFFTTARSFPLFIIWFVIAMTVESLGLVPAGWHQAISDLALWMITAALAAIGLSVRVKSLRTIGYKPVLFGLALWAIIAVTSLGLGTLTHSI